MGGAISVLIVDDEPLARERLRRLLRAEPAVEVVGECADGNEALVAIHTARPQVVFLDVEMPGGDGLELATRLPGPDRPLLVFVTAHERYALAAFNLQAVDYLLKPFDSERLHQALDRVQARLDAPAGRRDSSAGAGCRLSFRIDDRIVFFQAQEIDWLEADNDQTVLHLTDRRVVVHEVLTAVETRLGPVGFIRINPSTLVRFDQIREIVPALYDDHVLMLRDGTKLALNRSLRGQLARFVTGGR